MRSDARGTCGDARGVCSAAQRISAEPLHACRAPLLAICASRSSISARRHSRRRSPRVPTTSLALICEARHPGRVEILVPREALEINRERPRLRGDSSSVGSGPHLLMSDSRVARSGALRPERVPRGTRSCAKDVFPWRSIARREALLVSSASLHVRCASLLVPWEALRMIRDALIASPEALYVRRETLRVLRERRAALRGAVRLPCASQRVIRGRRRRWIGALIALRRALLESSRARLVSGEARCPRWSALPLPCDSLPGCRGSIHEVREPLTTPRESPATRRASLVIHRASPNTRRGAVSREPRRPRARCTGWFL